MRKKIKKMLEIRDSIERCNNGRARQIHEQLYALEQLETVKMFKGNRKLNAVDMLCDIIRNL